MLTVVVAIFESFEGSSRLNGNAQSLKLRELTL
jgi:hypothetical protein